MIVTLAYCLRDQDITLQLFDWIAELCPQKSRHQLWLLHDPRCDKTICKAILESAQRSFEVSDMVASAEIDGWPQGANYMFRNMATTMSYNKDKYFLWLEPDAIPLKPDWLDAIEAEYLKSGKPFMGDRVEVNDIPLHMSGVGIYQNPIYILAGEAYRAADTAWDMAAKDQIVPNAHFTKLIEHAWKHPTFTSQDELTTQIRPETVLFHASKDGSLINLLREQVKQRSVGTRGASIGSGSCSLPESTPSNGEPISPPLPIYDIFIRTYPVDYPWLQFCLRSIYQYCKGFRKIWIVSPEEPPEWFSTRASTDVIEWKVLNEESSDGYLSQQIHKLYADVVTNYECDYILHIDSDTLFTRPVTPQDFFKDGKLIWYYTPYEHTDTPWKPITEKFMKAEVKYEFMRRLPMMVPKYLYDQVRQFCRRTHNLILSDYIRKQPYREFSEFNVLGAYALSLSNDTENSANFEWIDTTKVQMPEPFARQFYSWGGLTEEVKAEIQTILSGDSTVGAQSEKATSLGQPTAQNTSEDDGYESPGDHVRWLATYCEGSPSRRQYVLNQLAKVNLKALRRGRKPKKKAKI